MSNFHPPEVVGRGSETQLQVGENLNDEMQLLRGQYTNMCITYRGTQKSKSYFRTTCPTFISHTLPNNAKSSILLSDG